jgi:hypothetical protein
MKTTKLSRLEWRTGKKLLTGALAAAVMATLGASHAQAVDSKLYPASMCIRWQGPEHVLNSGRIFNPAASGTIRLDCPIVRDSLTTKGIKEGYVDMIDLSPTAERVCADLQSISQFNRASTVAKSTGRKCTTGPNAGNSQRVFFGGFTPDVNAHYFYSVSIPPAPLNERSGIISYRVDEK